MDKVCTLTRVMFIMAISSLAPVTSYRTGAGSNACPDLKPGHGVDGQTTASPYSIQLSTQQYSAGSEVKVTIQSKTDGVKFRGFLVQARTVDGNNVGNTAVGTFKDYTDGISRGLSCFDVENSAATHANNTDKTSVTVTWSAPKNQNASVQFLYTVVQTVPEFWVAEKSATVDYSYDNAGTRAGQEMNGALLFTTLMSALALIKWSL